MIPVFGRPSWGDHELEATLGYIGKTVKMKRKKGRLRVSSSSYTKADTDLEQLHSGTCELPINSVKEPMFTPVLKSENN